MIVSDIMMPGLSGYELCDRIKKDARGHDTPVVLLSTLVDPMDIIRGLECGADNFIAKPYEPEQLVDRIRTVFRNRRARTKGKLAFGVEVVFLEVYSTLTSGRRRTTSSASSRPFLLPDMMTSVNRRSHAVPWSISTSVLLLTKPSRGVQYQPRLSTTIRWRVPRCGLGAFS
jgi:DNA-binding response OmpR family regulator